MSADTPSTIALFYDGYEMKAADGMVGAAYSNARRGLRYAYRTLRQRQVHTGFYTAFRGLVSSLTSAGVRVRVNDFAYARAHPHDPIGIAGYPSVLHKVNLPNPIIFGPGDYGMGDAAVRLAQDPKVKFLTQPCDWAVELNRQWVGDKGASYFAGIDTTAWPDLSRHSKTHDFIVYDKIRWHRAERTTSILGACLRELDKRNLSYRVLRYGDHHISDFKAGLADARALLFLCEHETQGLAYQEAMSSGVPVLAWDEGVAVDPAILAVASDDLRVSSVPYFDARCGIRFRIADFEQALTDFQLRQGTFEPRQYVLDSLSLGRSAEAYLSLYRAAQM